MYKYKWMVVLSIIHHNYTKDYLSNLNLVSEQTNHPVVFFSSSLLSDFSLTSGSLLPATFFLYFIRNTAKLLSPMDNQELHHSVTVASALQSSFSIMAPSATYGVSTPTASIISLPNTKQVMSLKLFNTNFLYWRMQMEPFLLGQGVYFFVDGTSSCPPSHLESVVASSPSINPAYLTWKQQYHLIMSALLSSLSVEVMHLVVDCNTSHDIWRMLKTILASPSNSRIMQLHVSFQELCSMMILLAPTCRRKRHCFMNLIRLAD